jgi:hypothetical protein
MGVLRSVAIVAMVMTIAACGAAGGGGAAAPSPTPSQVPLPGGPAAGFDVLITDQDRDVSVRVGQRIEVFLRAKPGMTDWSSIQVDIPGVLVPVPTGIASARGVTVAGFDALTAGVVNITANAGPQCPPNAMCPMYEALFSVRVSVT